MKRAICVFIVALLVGSLAGCGQSKPDADSASGVQSSAPMEETKTKEPKEETMPAVAVPEEVPAPEEAHTHEAYQGDNIVPHENMGYCGNTMTEVTYTHIGKDGTETWTKSFWGSKSVNLTDMLLNLDYSEDMCKCLPEYTVETEFGEGYGVSLTEGYARHGDRQISLTADQLAVVMQIFTELAGDGFSDGDCLD